MISQIRKLNKREPRRNTFPPSLSSSLWYITTVCLPVHPHPTSSLHAKYLVCPEVYKEILIYQRQLLCSVSNAVLLLCYNFLQLDYTHPTPEHHRHTPWRFGTVYLWALHKVLEINAILRRARRCPTGRFMSYKGQLSRATELKLNFVRCE